LGENKSTEHSLKNDIKRLRDRLKEIERSEERYRSLFQNIPIGLYLTTPDGKILDANPALVKLLGYPDLETLLKTNPFDIFLDPQDRSQEKDLIEREGTLRGYETQFKRRDGQLIWVRDHVKAVMDEASQVRFYEGSLEDISESKQAQDELIRRAAQLVIINDIGKEITAELDLDLTFERTVQLIQEGFGYHQVVLYTFNPEHDVLVSRARAGRFKDLYPLHHTLKLGQGMIGWVGKHAKMLLSNDVIESEQYYNPFPDSIYTYSELSVPLLAGKEVLGVLDVQSQERNAFDHEDVLVIETLADQIAVAIENAHLYKSLQEELLERKQAEEALRVSEARYRTLFEAANDGIFLMKYDRFVDCNSRVLDIYGCQRDQILDHTPYEFSPTKQPNGKNSKALALKKIEAALSGEPQFFEWRHCRLDGNLFDAEISLNRVRIGGDFFIQAIVRDITERKQVQERLQHLATHDPLTDLPNRHLLHDHLDRAIARSRRHKRVTLDKPNTAVMLLDLDHFKNINDTFGHGEGDLLLKTVAGRLRNCIRQSDIIGRMGGDEFTLVLEEIKSKRDCSIIAEKILNTLAEPINLTRCEIKVTASIGISLFPEDGQDAGILLKNADIAMYLAKKERNGYRFYSDVNSN